MKIVRKMCVYLNINQKILIFFYRLKVAPDKDAFLCKWMKACSVEHMYVEKSSVCVTYPQAAPAGWTCSDSTDASQCHTPPGDFKNVCCSSDLPSFHPPAHFSSYLPVISILPVTLLFYTLSASAMPYSISLFFFIPPPSQTHPLPFSASLTRSLVSLFLLAGTERRQTHGRAVL